MQRGTYTGLNGGKGIVWGEESGERNRVGVVGRLELGVVGKLGLEISEGKWGCWQSQMESLVVVLGTN